MDHLILKKSLSQKSSKSRAIVSRSFFKTGKGQYGEGDIFIGVSIPTIRLIAKKYALTPMSEIVKLIQSSIHEERSLGLIFLVNKFKIADLKERQKIHRLYLKYRKHINNWDLVDGSAPVLLGRLCFEGDSHQIMDRLLKSKRHWDRRMAIVGTLSFIKSGETRLTFQYAQNLLDDREDLMHKATGWMLREAGKKDPQGLRRFIKEFGKRMPRTMLRYAIEKFSRAERSHILKETKN